MKVPSTTRREVIRAGAVETVNNAKLEIVEVSMGGAPLVRISGTQRDAAFFNARGAHQAALFFFNIAQVLEGKPQVESIKEGSEDEF